MMLIKGVYMSKLQTKLFGKIAISLLFIFVLIASTTVPTQKADAASSSLAGFK